MSIGIGLSHDTAIAVVLDGRLVYASEVERISRFKKNLVCDKTLNDVIGYLPCDKRVNVGGIAYSLKRADEFLRRHYDTSIKDANIIVLNFDIYDTNNTYKEMIELYTKSAIDELELRSSLVCPPCFRFNTYNLINDVRRTLEYKQRRHPRVTSMMEEIERSFSIHVAETFEKYAKFVENLEIKSFGEVFAKKLSYSLVYHLSTHTSFRNMLSKWLGRDSEKIELLHILRKCELFHKSESNIVRSQYIKKVPYSTKLSRKSLRAFYKLLTADVRDCVERTLEFIWKKLFGSKPPKIISINHHLAHAASAYYTSGKRKAMAITIDGKGEYESNTVWVVENGEFHRISSFPYVRYTLGFFYENITQCLGFSFLDAGKTMGLAPYGREDRRFSSLMKELIEIYSPTSDRPYKLKVPSDEIYDYLKRRGFCPKWDPKSKPINSEATNLAFAAQRTLERAYLVTMEWAKERTGMKEAVLAGGVVLNAKANMELLYNNVFIDVFFFPGANDAGTAIGAALWAYEHILGGRVRNERVETVYWGNDVDDIDEAIKLAKRMGYRVERDYDIEALVDDYLLKNKLVAIVQGRAEFGPRALGHRSIVADPRIAENWERVNFHKGREWWRPLAPSLLAERAAEYFMKGYHLPFMIVMERFKDEETCKRVPVVCHVDLTARPQTVTSEIDRNWYSLIKSFGKATGEYLITNTSFNLGGEPLVDNARQALISMTFGGLDAVWIEGTLFYR